MPQGAFASGPVVACQLWKRLRALCCRHILAAHS